MLWRKKANSLNQPLPTMIQLVRAEAEELNKIQRATCANQCRFFDEVTNSYPETNSPCDFCELNRYVARKMEEAELLGVVHRKEDNEP